MGSGDGVVGDGSVRVPAELDWLRESRRGRDWLTSLPARLAAVRERWGLRTGRQPFQGGRVSLVLPATLPDGAAAVLKLAYPDPESEHEAAALTRWAGDGAVRLLANDPDLHALLLERCEPGTPLHQAGPDRALDVLTALLPRLWVPAGAPFTPLAGEAARWAATLPSRWEAAGRPGGRRLLDTAVRMLTELGPSQGEQVLLHQDLHTGNVLAAGREPWLVIDPKPLAGEREFGVVAAVRGGELGDDPDRLRYRLDRLCSDLGLDRERVRGWALGQTLAWSFQNGQVLTDQLDRAGWLLDC